MHNAHLWHVLEVTAQLQWTAWFGSDYSTEWRGSLYYSAFQPPPLRLEHYRQPGGLECLGFHHHYRMYSTFSCKVWPLFDESSSNWSSEVSTLLPFYLTDQANWNTLLIWDMWFGLNRPHKNWGLMGGVAKP